MPRASIGIVLVVLTLILPVSCSVLQGTTTFINNASQTVTVIFLDEQAQEIERFDLAPGEEASRARDYDGWTWLPQENVHADPVTESVVLNRIVVTFWDL